MKTNVITIDADKLYMPLAQCSVGKLSSAVFTVNGDIPDDVENLSITVEYSGGEYVAAGTKQADGSFTVYFAPSYFPDATDSLMYHVIGTDSKGNPRWLGSGVLRIFDNPANGGGAVPSIIPAGSYAYDETTGLYHKLLASRNELGEITVEVDPDGVSM